MHQKKNIRGPQTENFVISAILFVLLELEQFNLVFFMLLLVLLFPLPSRSQILAKFC